MKSRNEKTIDDLLRERLDDFVKILTFTEVTSIQNLFDGELNHYVYAKTEFERFHNGCDQAVRNKTVNDVYRRTALYNRTGLDRYAVQHIFGKEPNSTKWLSTKLYLPLIDEFCDRKNGVYVVKGERHAFSKHYSVGYGRLS